jgi:hypothetical protein
LFLRWLRISKHSHSGSSEFKHRIIESEQNDTARPSDAGAYVPDKSMLKFPSLAIFVIVDRLRRAVLNYIISSLFRSHC